jgi:hypothetical protein
MAMDGNGEQSIAATFQYLESALSRAVECSPVPDPEQLPDLLPQCAAPARRLILAELVKLDMAKAAELGQIRSLSFYNSVLAKFFQPDELPLDLVLEEVQLLRRLGRDPGLDDLKVRYPHLATLLDELMTRPSPSSARRMIEKVPSFPDGARVDDFTILRTLGRGGFASVYLARQNSMQRLVALKVSHRGSDEPIALSQLDHPSIVRVFDQRQISDPEALLLYMQYVPGGTLAEVIAATGALPASDLGGRQILAAIDRALLAASQPTPEHNLAREQLAALDWSQAVAFLGVQLAEGLAAAHERGIMHRDVKPANILLSSEGVPKLADFNVSYSGIAGCAGAAVHFGGSLLYMSPEQLQVADPSGSLRPEDLDPRSDLYSLGLVLWELWQGRRPAVGSEAISSWHEAVMRQLQLRRVAPQCVRAFDSAATRVLQKALLQTLQFDRQRRPHSGYELAGRLRLALVQRAAELFEPAANSLYARIGRLPVLITTALIIFVPNGLAGALNYQYNLASIVAKHPDMRPLFVDLSVWINSIAFPIGAMLLVWFAQPVRRALKRAAQGQPATEGDKENTWNLGHRAAVLGGILWLAAGIAFPVVLLAMHPGFQTVDALEFFLSLSICGGIAWIYPFFGVSLLITEIYYPAIIAPTMVDMQFEKRAAQLKRRATVYLASAAAIPLAALALLAVQQGAGAGQAKGTPFLLVVIVLTAVALLFAFLAYQRLNDTTAQLRAVLDQSARPPRA